jgi:nucleoside-diphosphate-sugar epimerase
MEVALAEADGAEVVISYPPEAGLDRGLAAALAEHRPQRLVYLSSTGVFGGAVGRVDEDTPTSPDEPRAAGRLAAEDLYRDLGGVILRVAGIYGPGRGVHQRLSAGTWRLPGDGSGHVSRVHVDDLVGAIETALERAPPGQVLCVADDQAATHRELAQFVCERLRLPMPPQIPLEQVHPSLRANRQVSNARLRALGWAAAYPTFREGYEALWAEEAATASVGSGP